MTERTDPGAESRLGNRFKRMTMRELEAGSEVIEAKTLLAEVDAALPGAVSAEDAPSALLMQEMVIAELDGEGSFAITRLDPLKDKFQALHIKSIDHIVHFPTPNVKRHRLQGGERLAELAGPAVSAQKEILKLMRGGKHDGIFVVRAVREYPHGEDGLVRSVDLDQDINPHGVLSVTQILIYEGGKVTAREVDLRLLRFFDGRSLVQLTRLVEERVADKSGFRTSYKVGTATDYEEEIEVEGGFDVKAFQVPRQIPYESTVPLTRDVANEEWMRMITEPLSADEMPHLVAA